MCLTKGFCVGSKSITNRALILAALASKQRPVKLKGVLQSDDTGHMIKALKSFGVEIEAIGETELDVKLGSDGFSAPGNAEEFHEVFVGIIFRFTKSCYDKLWLLR